MAITARRPFTCRPKLIKTKCTYKFNFVQINMHMYAVSSNPFISLECILTKMIKMSESHII